MYIVWDGDERLWYTKDELTRCDFSSCEEASAPERRRVGINIDIVCHIAALVIYSLSDVECV
jgi:hypothetical protein